MKQVIEFDGSYVNHRHLAILCDIMTYKVRGGTRLVLCVALDTRLRP